MTRLLLVSALILVLMIALALLRPSPILGGFV